MLPEFVKLLRKQDNGITDEDIADILWLTLHTRNAPGEDRQKLPGKAPKDEGSNSDGEKSNAPLGQNAPPSDSEQPPHQAQQFAAELHHRTSQSSGMPQTQKKGMAFRSPAVTALPGSLALGRALRPLMRRIPSHSLYTLDEDLTAHLLAEQLLARQAVLLPALQPVPLRWLEVALLIDESRSMHIWQATIQAFKNLLECHGAFRDVRTWDLLLDAYNRVRVRPRNGSVKHTHLHDPAELIDPRGQRLILIISDCISNIWYSKELSKSIKSWSMKGPVSIIQVLPQRLWPRSALGDAIEVQIHAKTQAAPNIQLDYEPASYLIKKSELKGGFPIPVVALQSDAITQWVQAILKAEKVWAPGYIFGLQTESEPTNDLSNLTARQLVQNFSINASPAARALLGLLASAPISLPVIRLIQHTMLPQSNLGHVAEVLLGGLIEQSPTKKDEYEFVEGIRDLLLESRPKSETLHILMKVSDFLESHVGQSLDIRALLADPRSSNNLITIDDNSRPFALVATKIFHKLGAEYAALANHLERASRPGFTIDVERAAIRNEQAQSESTKIYTKLENLQKDFQQEMQTLRSLLRIRNYRGVPLALQICRHNLVYIFDPLYDALENSSALTAEQIATIENLNAEDLIDNNPRQKNAPTRYKIIGSLRADMIEDQQTIIQSFQRVLALKRAESILEKGLQQTTLPRLEPRIVKTFWSSSNVRECHIEITNNGERPAQDVHVHILPSENGDYQDDPKTHQFGSILAHPSAVTRAIPIVIQNNSENIADKEAIDLFIRLDYYDRERVKKETDPIRLHLSLRDEITFSKIRNPYQTGLPIIDSPMFIGREELIEELSSEMLRQKRTSALVIYGQKRSGKTSILRNLETYLLDQPKETAGLIIPVYFSVQTILAADSESILQSMLYLIADEISQQCYKLGIGDQIGELTWDQMSNPPEPTIQFRMYLNKIRRLPKTRLVLLIDEFTELAARIDEGKIERSIMRFLKSLIEQGFFSCIICGLDTMPQVLSTYANELAVSDPHTIDYLSPKAARKLIEDPIRLPDGRSRFTSPQVVDELIRLTAGSPYYIQFVCHRLVEYMNRETRNALITGADIDHVVNGLIYGTSTSAPLDPYTKFDNLTRYRGDDTDTYDSLVEGLFLYLLAEETRNRQFAPFNLIWQYAPFISEVEFLNVADQLEQRQVIERNSGATRQYKIIVDLFRRWINAQRPIDQEALERFRTQIKLIRGF